MAKNMFMSTHNHWFSRLALLSCLVLLSVILLGTYAPLLATDNPIREWTELFQHYLPTAVIAVTVLLAGAALYLHRELSYKPFVICLGLLLVTISPYFIDLFPNATSLTTNTPLTQTLLHLLMLSFLWWLSSITGPRDPINAHESDKKYRLWAWLGIALIFTQLLLSTWVTMSHADLACTDFPYCNGQLLPSLNIHALWITPLSQDALVTLNTLHKLCTILTTAYLTLLSIFILFNRALGELAVLLFIFMLIQVALSSVALFWTHTHWIIFTHDLISMLLLFSLISLLIHLYRIPVESYN